MSQLRGIMQNLLRIDSSPMHGSSISRSLTANFVERWKASHPGGHVITRDLAETALRPVTAEWIGAAYTPESSRSLEQQKLLSLSDTLISELHSANEYVVGVAMHNFSI